MQNCRESFYMVGGGMPCLILPCRTYAPTFALTCALLVLLHLPLPPILILPSDVPCPSHHICPALFPNLPCPLPHVFTSQFPSNEPCLCPTSALSLPPHIPCHCRYMCPALPFMRPSLVPTLALPLPSYGFCLVSAFFQYICAALPVAPIYLSCP